MLEEFVSSVGLPTLVLIIVGVSLLVVVILVMSYFKVLLSIANFTYPNAKFRAEGTPFLKKEKLEPLIESRNINEVLSEIRDEGYELPKEAADDILEAERELEKEMIASVKRAFMATPEDAKEFVNAWLNRYDVRMVKRAIKAIDRGTEKEDLRRKIQPVKIIDKGMIDDMVSARNVQELTSILKDTELGEVLSGQEWKDNFFLLDVELDRFAYERLKKAVNKAGAEERAPLKYFFGKYTDLMNLKIVLRGLRGQEDIEEETLKEALLPAGRELEHWKLENMIESNNMEEALVELEGTSYEDLRSESASMSHYDLEKYLDKKLYSLISEIMSQHVLSVGPMVKYLVGKELEFRNLKVIIRGVKEGVSPEMIRDMVIMEER